MRHTAANVFMLILTGAFAAPTWSQQTAHVTPAKATTSKPAGKVTPPPQLVFGSIGIASNSVAAKQQLEIALDSYETAQYAEAVKHAQIAAEKDPQSALAYAVWSYAARWIGSAPDALEKAQALSAKSAPDEKLLVAFMVGTQQADSLPAIIAMNDLVQKHPKDKHVLYLAGDWLFSQEDYVRGRKLLEKSLEQDPNFAPALNSLGYAYVQSLEPAKGISLLRKYADALPDDPNAQDSLGEVLRMTGDDEGSLARYAAALGISSTFITSQYGRGDTFTLMGKYSQARAEYDKALNIATNEHDILHIKFQKALVFFWQGDLGTGRAELAALSAKAAEANDMMAQFEIDYARVLLAPDTKTASELLATMEAHLSNVPADKLTAERNEEYASVLREEVRLALAAHKQNDADALIQKLDQLAAASRDQKVESIYESARGYVMAANGDYADAVDELTSDLHSPLVVQQLIVAQEKLNNPEATEKAQVRLKYLRTPTAEWYVVSKHTTETAQSAAN
ncbi:MAG: tetratricopeptide repeat protein [Candidatus Acidiferrum sp.]|jgi:tetratricopeptide (TPR) repeat protein